MSVSRMEGDLEGFSQLAPGMRKRLPPGGDSQSRTRCASRCSTAARRSEFHRLGSSTGKTPWTACQRPGFSRTKCSPGSRTPSGAGPRPGRDRRRCRGSRLVSTLEHVLHRAGDELLERSTRSVDNDRIQLVDRPLARRVPTPVGRDDWWTELRRWPRWNRLWVACKRVIARLCPRAPDRFEPVGGVLSADRS